MAGMKGKELLMIAALAVGIAVGMLMEHRFTSLRTIAVPTAETAAPSEESDPLTEFRTQREQQRSRQRAQLNDIVYSDRSDEETVRLAQRQLIELNTDEAREMTLEGLLSMKGIGETVVDVSGEAVNVIVRGEALTERQTAVILDLVLRETGVTGGNVKIITIN